MKKKNWTVLVILLVIAALIWPLAYQYGQRMARDGMDKAMAEKAKIEAEQAGHPRQDEDN